MLFIFVVFILSSLHDVMVQAFSFGRFNLGYLIPSSPKLSKETMKRETLYNEILECFQKGEKDRSVIEKYIDELAELNPTPSSASSNLLAKEWLMIWTTEKEINFFSDFNISGEISQKISSDGTLKNLIEFRNGGGLSVAGILEKDDNISVRTNFKFTSAKLDLGFASFSIPPVGEGWFDTIYLDEKLRIDKNSRDDILICTPK